MQRVKTNLKGNKELLLSCVITPEEEKKREALRSKARMLGAARPVSEVESNILKTRAHLTSGPRQLEHYAPPTPPKAHA